MNRRRFFSTLVGASAALRAPGLLSALPSHGIGGIELARPTPYQTAWQNLELGVLLRCGPRVWESIAPAHHPIPFSDLKLDFNTDQWADCALKVGAKYVILVAKHANGFCLWKTHTTSNGIWKTSWQGGHGDLVASMSKSCRERGLKMGVYLSPQDRTFGAGIGGRCKTPQAQAKYNRVYREQLKELLTGYGPIIEIWFDGSIAVPVGDILKRYAPHAMKFQGPEATLRWVGNEDGFAPYPVWNPISKAIAETGISTAVQGSPNGSAWLPVESDISIIHPHWFWTPRNQEKLLSLERLTEIYYRTIGRGTQMLLALPPDANGMIPKETCQRAQEFGDEIRRRFGHSLAETSGSGWALAVKLPSPRRVDTVILQEDCSFGQRVRAFRLEGLSSGKWVDLGKGISIGHKRIQPVPPNVVSAVRFIAEKSTGKPQIRRLALFDTGVNPPAGWNAPLKFHPRGEVGMWHNHRFRVDLSRHIVAATLYRLRFVSQGGNAVTIEDPVLLIGGVPEPNLIRRSKSNPDALVLTITAIGQDVVIKGRIKGAEQGFLLLRRQ